ncbi:hypothetical protein DKM19_17915 [Streptosporangium sp. 'caverna']|nr:hypothetical protein DKM19_17915 [Streptosporangium sp. 'caverna']
MLAMAAGIVIFGAVVLALGSFTTGRVTMEYNELVIGSEPPPVVVPSDTAIVWPTRTGAARVPLPKMYAVS